MIETLVNYLSDGTGVVWLAALDLISFLAAITAFILSLFAKNIATKTRLQLLRNDSSDDLQRVIGKIDEIITMQRSSNHNGLFDKYSLARTYLLQIKSNHPDLSIEQASTLQEICKNLRDNESAIAKGFIEETQDYKIPEKINKNLLYSVDTIKTISLELRKMKGE